MSRSNIVYPGGLLAKRIGHLAALSTIGLTIFVGAIQTDLIEFTRDQTNSGFQTSFRMIQTTRGFLEESKVASILFDWLSGRSISLSAFHNQLDQTESTLHFYQESSEKLFAFALFMLTLVGLFSLKIAHSALWVYYDIKFGDASDDMKRNLGTVLMINLISVVVLFSLYQSLPYLISTS